jgi:uncharacterized Zn finger protein
MSGKEFKGNPFMPRPDDIAAAEAMTGQKEIQITKQMIEDAMNLKCEKCNHVLFEEKHVIKRLSPIVTGLPQEQILKLPVLACANCGHVSKKMGAELIREDIKIKK